LHAVENPESIAGVKTYYKPSQWRGKRLIYVTTDPAERKKQTVIGWIVFSIVGLSIGVVAWLTY
jgi:hypothetical protein